MKAIICKKFAPVSELVWEEVGFQSTKFCLMPCGLDMLYRSHLGSSSAGAFFDMKPWFYAGLCYMQL